MFPKKLMNAKNAAAINRPLLTVSQTSGDSFFMAIRILRTLLQISGLPFRAKSIALPAFRGNLPMLGFWM